jgi:hypothetical protein
MKRLLVSLVAACLLINLYLTYSIQAGKKATAATHKLTEQLKEIDVLRETKQTQSKKPSNSRAAFS